MDRVTAKRSRLGKLRAGKLAHETEVNVGKDTLDKAADAVKRTVDDVKDTVHEGQHRSAADMERAKRETLGNEMTPGEKIGSAVNEAKNRTQAEYDATKRDIREKT
ncbi:MAG: hypothetical protein ACLQHL_05985 [Candidatus Cybelea sp.]